MRTVHFTAILVATAGIASAQSLPFRLLMDAPGPGYREMAGEVKPETAAGVPTQFILSFAPKDVTTAKLVPVDNGLSQIALSFRREATRQIKDYIEFNKARPIRVEIGDYTLPLDIRKTLPWTGRLWLEARPPEKAKTILETLKQQSP